MRPTSRFRVAPAALGTALTVAVATLAGCGRPDVTADRVPARGQPRAPLPVIRITPAPNTTKARLGQNLVVRAVHGTLRQVVAFAGRVRVTGRFTRSHAMWRSRWTLRPGTEYAVSASAAGPGGSTTETGKFRTLPVKREFAVRDVTPSPGETVGVGMPVIVTFTGPVHYKAAVERALEVRAAKRAEGSWRWAGDTQVIYRTHRTWPSRQRIVFTAHLSGVQAAPGVYGTADRTVAFTIGRRQVSVIDTHAHRMLVRRDGAVVQRMAISAGMATTLEYTTTSGVHLTMDKGDPVRMISPHREKGQPGYYDVLIDDAVRISNSGEYVHAKNNVWAQGRLNVSHGCINARPDQAAWFYAHSLRGDPVIVTGTGRELGWDNGWGYWQLSWANWLKGSALRRDYRSK